MREMTPSRLLVETRYCDVVPLGPFQIALFFGDLLSAYIIDAERIARYNRSRLALRCADWTQVLAQLQDRLAPQVAGRRELKTLRPSRQSR